MNNERLTDDCFQVDVKLEAVTYSFSIHTTSNEDQVSYFVGLDGVDIGELIIDEHSVWKWKEGGFDGTSAGEIGSKIESHYE